MNSGSSLFLSTNGLLQVGMYVLAIWFIIRPLGKYMAFVYKREHLFLDCIFGPIERFCYKIICVDPDSEMCWKRYATSLLTFSFVSFLLLFSIVKWQGYLPLNPQQFSNISSDLAFNIAASYITNTDWQSYSGETTLSNFSQMVGLTVQNFLSAAVGMAVFVAFVRSFSRKVKEGIGNFWVDLVRGTLYILLPISFLLSLILGAQGVVQSFKPYESVPLWESTHREAPSSDKQQIAVGPVASQVAIKQLGSNGGGFFNVNAAHPYENPTTLTNFLELLSILMIPLSLCYTFGILVRDRRQGWAIFKTMTILFAPLCLLGIQQEYAGNPYLSIEKVDQTRSHSKSHEQRGGNMEGKETRFGVFNSALWAAATTATSNGSTNASLDSFTALGGAVPLLFMQLSEVSYGGVGSGLYGMLLYVIVAVFIAGLMVGRTPEYLGKKIQPFEMKMASLAILITPCIVLLFTAIAVMTEAGRVGISNPGAHGFTQILYNITSAANGNGSSFAGLKANTPFYNILFGVACLICRYGIICLILAIAGSFVTKRAVPATAGTLSTYSFLFIFFLIGVIFLVGFLIYMTPFIIGPVVEYLSFVAPTS